MTQVPWFARPKDIPPGDIIESEDIVRNEFVLQFRWFDTRGTLQYIELGRIPNALLMRAAGPLTIDIDWAGVSAEIARLNGESHSLVHS